MSLETTCAQTPHFSPCIYACVPVSLLVLSRLKGFADNWRHKSAIPHRCFIESESNSAFSNRILILFEAPNLRFDSDVLGSCAARKCLLNVPNRAAEASLKRQEHRSDLLFRPLQVQIMMENKH